MKNKTYKEYLGELNIQLEKDSSKYSLEIDDLAENSERPEILTMKAYEILSPEIPDKYIDALIGKDNSNNKYLTAKMIVDSFVSTNKQSKLEKLGIR